MQTRWIRWEFYHVCICNQWRSSQQFKVFWLFCQKCLLRFRCYYAWLKKIQLSQRCVSLCIPYPLKTGYRFFLKHFIYDSFHFLATNGTFCGNKIVEDGEQCDCGFSAEECQERCCYPRRIKDEDKLQNPQATGCTRRPSTRCSPSEGPCCESTCDFVHASKHAMCKHTTECSYSSYCNGTSAQCPVPKPKADLTPCHDGTQVCSCFSDDKHAVLV